VEIHRPGTDVLQLDERDITRPRMIMDLAHDDRPDARATVGLSRRRRALQREEFLTTADQVAPKRHSVQSRAKREPVTISREITCGISGEKIDVVVLRIEGETRP